jgi:hypothetical protein
MQCWLRSQFVVLSILHISLGVLVIASRSVWTDALRVTSLHTFITRSVLLISALPVATNNFSSEELLE